MKKILIVDGQGGRVGAAFVEQIIQGQEEADLIVVGTNSFATQTMMKAGSKIGATGENPIIINAKSVDIIIAPIGFMIADSLYGEVTAAMTEAIYKSPAKKIILPFNECGDFYFATEAISMSRLIEIGIKRLRELLREN